MKNCAACGADLPDPVFEYGDMREPVCFHCFMDPHENKDDAETAAHIAELEDEISDCNGQIANFQDEIFDLEEEVRRCRREIESLQEGKILNVRETNRKLSAWTAGEAIKDERTYRIHIEG